MTEKIPAPKKSPDKSPRIHSSQPSAIENVQPLKVQSEPRSMSNILSLQPIIGNQAVRRMIDGDNKRIQRDLNVKLTGDQNPSTVTNLETLCAKFGIKAKDLVPQIKTRLFRGALFPAKYKDSYDQNIGLQKEMQDIVDRAITASVSPTVITAPSGNAIAVATHLYNIISPSINAPYLNNFEHYRNITTLGDVQGTNYMAFLNTIVPTLTRYKSQIPKFGYSEQDNKMRNRVEKFTEQAKSLINKLSTATQAQAGTNVTDPIIDEIEQFRAELTDFEHAWDLDFLTTARELENTVETDLAQNVDLGDKYKVGGGTDDGMSVGTQYNANLACTLFAILCVKPGWLGAAHPSDLHRILRKSDQLKDYDDDRTAAKLRYLAGLTATMVGGENKKVGEYLQNKKRIGEKENIIIDAEGIAHTFAAKWTGNEFKKVDEATPQGGSFGEYLNKRVLTVWK